MRKTDLVASIVIGEAAALLMIAIGRVITLPDLVAPYLGHLAWGFPVVTLGIMAAGSLAGRRIAVAYPFSKFLLVGGLNFLIDLGTLNFFIALTGVTAGFSASVFKAAAFLVAVTSSFFWNKFWTFRSLSIEHAGRQFAEFLAVSAVGLGLNVGTFVFVNDVSGPLGGIDERTWASVSAIGAAVVGLLWNFIGYKFFVFRKAQT